MGIHRHEPDYSQTIITSAAAPGQPIITTGTCGCGTKISRIELPGVSKVDNRNPYTPVGEPFVEVNRVVEIEAYNLRQHDKLPHDTLGLREIASPIRWAGSQIEVTFADGDTERLPKDQLVPVYVVDVKPTDAQRRVLADLIEHGGVDVPGTKIRTGSYGPTYAARRQGWLTQRRLDEQGHIGYTLTEYGRATHERYGQLKQRAKIERVNAATMFKTNCVPSGSLVRLANRSGTEIGTEWVEFGRIERSTRSRSSYDVYRTDGSVYVTVYGQNSFEIKPAGGTPAEPTSPAPVAPAGPATVDADGMAPAAQQLDTVQTRLDARSDAAEKAARAAADVELIDAAPAELSTGLPPALAGATVVAPRQVERTTGTFRVPSAFVDVDKATGGDLLRGPQPTGGPVVGVAIHVLVRRAVVIGPFDNPDAAREWWYASFNRLASDLGMLFVLRPAPGPQPAAGDDQAARVVRDVDGREYGVGARVEAVTHPHGVLNGDRGTVVDVGGVDGDEWCTVAYYRGGTQKRTASRVRVLATPDEIERAHAEAAEAVAVDLAARTSATDTSALGERFGQLAERAGLASVAGLDAAALPAEPPSPERAAAWSAVGMGHAVPGGQPERDAASLAGPPPADVADAARAAAEQLPTVGRWPGDQAAPLVRDVDGREYGVGAHVVAIGESDGIEAGEHGAAYSVGTNDDGRSWVVVRWDRHGMSGRPADGVRLVADGEYTDPPRFPAGTPEHEAYAAELRTELVKFAHGEPLKQADEPEPLFVRGWRHIAGVRTYGPWHDVDPARRTFGESPLCGAYVRPNRAELARETASGRCCTACAAVRRLGAAADAEQVDSPEAAEALAAGHATVLPTPVQRIVDGLPAEYGREVAEAFAGGYRDAALLSVVDELRAIADRPTHRHRNVPGDLVHVAPAELRAIADRLAPVEQAQVEQPEPVDPVRVVAASILREYGSTRPTLADLLAAGASAEAVERAVADGRLYRVVDGGREVYDYIPPVRELLATYSPQAFAVAIGPFGGYFDAGGPGEVDRALDRKGYVRRGEWQPEVDADGQPTRSGRVTAPVDYVGFTVEWSQQGCAMSIGGAAASRPDRVWFDADRTAVDEILRREGWTRTGEWEAGLDRMIAPIERVAGEPVIDEPPVDEPDPFVDLLNREVDTDRGSGWVEGVDGDQGGAVSTLLVVLDRTGRRVKFAPGDVQVTYKLRRDVDECRSLFTSGVKVHHRNPDLADWWGVVVPVERGQYAGRVLRDGGPEHALDVRVRWSTGEASGQPCWYGARSLDVVSDDEYEQATSRPEPSTTAPPVADAGPLPPASGMPSQDG